MEEFETVRIGNAWYAKKNGVMSALSVAQIEGGAWAIFMPAIAYIRETKEEALAFCAGQMDTWYTATEAATRLVEMGVFDVAPSAHEVCTWARLGLLPGSVKVPKPGQGGSWRIPASALEALAERRGR